MAERKSKKVQPSLSRTTWPVVTQASRVTRTQRSSPGRMCEPTTASPSSARSDSSRASRASSVGAVSASSSGVVGASADDNRITLPALGHVLVLDALLEQQDALEQGLGPRGAAR